MVHRRKTEIVQVNLRLREELRCRLAKEAERYGRSFNAELVHRLEQSFVAEELTDTVLKGIAAGFERLSDGGPLGKDAIAAAVAAEKKRSK